MTTDIGAIYNDLMGAVSKYYDVPGRYYHNVDHINLMFHWFVVYKDKIVNKEAMAIAIAYHDAILPTDSPVGKSAESASIELMGADLSEKVDSETLDIAASLVIATQTHTPSYGHLGVVGDSRFFLDFDLSVFAADWKDVEDYDTNIRKEYSNVSDEVYYPARIALLERFLGRSRIFFSDPFFIAFEKIARENLAELIKLNRREYKRICQTRTAVYAGTFDPPTNGHMYVAKVGSKMFDTLYIAIGVNPSKKTMFSVEERIAMLEESCREAGLTNVKVCSYEGLLLVDYALDLGVDFIVRGIRSTEDYNYEAGLKLVNERVDPNLETIYLIPPRNLSEVSSSVVKSLVGFRNWERVAAQYVSSSVLKAMKDKVDGPTIV